MAEQLNAIARIGQVGPPRIRLTMPRSGRFVGVIAQVARRVARRSVDLIDSARRASRSPAWRGQV